MEERDIEIVDATPSFQSPPDPFEESGNCFDALYTPQVKIGLIPKLQQHFNKLEEVHNFYNNYAREAGFSVRVHSSKTNKEGETIRKEYVCSKQGMRKEVNVTAKRRRCLTREGCGAKISVVKNKSGEGFVVSQFVEIYNHPLTTPRKVHLLKSHRRVSEAQKALTEQLAAANGPSCQQMSILEMQSGGLENVGFIQRDLYNVARDKRKSLEGHDAILLYEHFESEKEKNLNFVFTFERDDEGRMTHCFWADATCLKSYKYFGDVVVFDTTYNTNRYSLIFAPIFGVNHHRQTTLFGCAFLSDETSDSFEWLFKEWLKAMPAGPPKVIITNQDPAMTKAIANTLPNTVHKYCIWHILSKFSEKIGAFAYKQHYAESDKCLWKAESIEEFESGWVDAITNSNLSNNEWLKALYIIREKWVPVYTKHIFSAHMTSSQRAEERHAFFKRYVSSENSLMDFVTRFDRAVTRIRHNELDLDQKDVNEKPILKTFWTMEMTMSKLYTRTIFHQFQDEIFVVGAYLVARKHEDEHRSLWSVRRHDIEGSRSRELSVDKSSSEVVQCSCKMFEFDGIPCRHILAYLTRMQILDMPNFYILKRWTNQAKSGRVMDDLGSKGKEISNFPILMRRQRLFQLACDVINDARLDEDGTNTLEKALQIAQQKIDVMRVSDHSRTSSQLPISHPESSSQMPISRGSQYSLKEPLQVRAKGCGRDKRLKRGKEKAIKAKEQTGRLCKGCDVRGVGHDKRNCPLLHGDDDNKLLENDLFKDGDGDGDGSGIFFVIVGMKMTCS